MLGSTTAKAAVSLAQISRRSMRGWGDVGSDGMGLASTCYKISQIALWEMSVVHFVFEHVYV